MKIFGEISIFAVVQIKDSFFGAFKGVFYETLFCQSFGFVNNGVGDDVAFLFR
jgi:hypothetical protein